MVVVLGFAFQSKPVEHIRVNVQNGPATEVAFNALSKNEKFLVERCDPEDCRIRLRTGKTDLVVIENGSETRSVEYFFDPTREESVLARNAVDDALQRASGRQDQFVVRDVEYAEPGGRYIDFLVPGLLGMGLMGGGLWGVGFVTVDLRMRKLVKRFLATPMKKRDFLTGIMVSRFMFMVPEVLVLLVFARYAFGVTIHGGILSIVALVVLGAFTFSGVGLLVASRAKTIEAVSGLMNLVMLPMWLLSGVFFASDRFPAVAQPFIRALPLTQLNNALRAVILDGSSLASQTVPVLILLVWGSVTFVLALKWFRWN
jgi:ABC-type multidrug transport system permease subunit